MSYRPLRTITSKLDARLDALHGYRAALLAEDNRVKLTLEDCGLPLRSAKRDAYYEADPEWRWARDRYRNAVAAAERAYRALYGDGRRRAR